jgi:hypothetical protein
MLQISKAGMGCAKPFSVWRCHLVDRSGAPAGRLRSLRQARRFVVLHEYQK